MSLNLNSFFISIFLNHSYLNLYIIQHFTKSKKYRKRGLILENYSEILKNQLTEIDKMLTLSNRNLSKLKSVPNRRIRVSRSNGCNQFYWVDKKTNKRIYVNNKEKDLLKKIVQRDYEISVNKKLFMLKKSLSNFLKKYDIDDIEKAYLDLPEARKSLVTPIINTKDEISMKWQSVPYDHMPLPEDSEFITIKGIKVRSKSELIIANLLEQYGVSYRYEYPVILKGLGAVRPDFMCYNKRTGKEYIWEHFGMMDNIAYSNKNINKINIYEQNGFIAGKNMIMTFESSANVLNTNMIMVKIKEYLI